MSEKDSDLFIPLVVILAALVAVGLYTKHTQEPRASLTPLDHRAAPIDDDPALEGRTLVRRRTLQGHGELEL